MLGLGLTLLPAAARAEGDLPGLAALETRGAATAGLVVDLERQRVLAARGADRALIPASTVKLATASLALQTWGPAHRFTTAVLRRGPLEDGVLRGDLVLRGGGDASLTAPDFWRLALDLAQRGLRRVEGDLVVDESLFGRLACTIEDRCEAEAASAHAFDAPLTSTPVDYNTLALTLVAGAQPGEAARLIPQPFVPPFLPPGLAIEGGVATAAGPARLTLERTSAGGIDRLRIAGQLPPGETLTLYRSLGEPALHAGRLFHAFLAQAGVAVAGAVRVEYLPVAPAEPLLDHQGAELARALDLMLGYSNNLLADTLALNLLGALRPGSAPDLPAAGALLGEYLAGAAAGSAFPAPPATPPPLLRDGSGLDPSARLSPRQLVQLLERDYRQAATFPTLVGALIVPAHGPQRSLPAPPGGQGAAAWDERLMVKSGGLSEPVSVTSLAGYFRFADGGWGAFAFLVNGAPGHPIARGEAFSAMRRDLTAYWTR